MSEGHVLIVDDEPEMLENCERLLSREGHRCTTLDRSSEFLRALRESRPDVVLCDLRMPERDGMDLLAAARKEDPDLPFILITGYASVASAVDAIQEGAFDYLAKPFQPRELGAAVTRALRQRRLAVENRELRDRVSRRDGIERIVGESPAMVRLKERIAKVAPIDVNVLIWGESGTGKELVARSLHAGSPRADGSFVPVDCASIPETLLESALFGHEKGSFTGADRRQRGLLEQADGGTVFLDEITQLDTHLQSRLLRVLQEREMRRVGGREVIELDIRVVAATNLEPSSAVAEGTFREDLYYRLNVIPITLPPLRDRGADVALLFQTFLRHFAEKHGKDVPTVTRGAWDAVEAYTWPGNVRQLRNLAERVTILDDDGRIAAGDLPGDLGPATGLGDAGSELADLPWDEAKRRTMEGLEERYATRLLSRHDGNVTRAAEAAGVSRRTFHRWLRRTRRDDNGREGGDG